MAKNKTLPKDFENLLKEADITKLKAVFDKCAFDAKGGFSKQTALAFEDCPDDLAHWLVEKGLDISTANSWDVTPLAITSRKLEGPNRKSHRAWSGCQRGGR